MIKYIVEFTGTFLFISIILRSKKFNILQPFVIVSGLLAAILLGGAISGGHFNPAISFMKHVNNSTEFGLYDLGGFVVAQLLGGLVALKIYQMYPDE